MKRLIMTMLTILSCGAAYALPVGNPSEASLLCDGLIWEGHCGCDPCDPCLTWSDAFSVRAGFYGDYVFNRHMKVEDDSFHAQIEKFRIFTNAGYLAANFWDRFDVFGTLGVSRMDLRTNVTAFRPTTLPDGTVTEIETQSRFSWSVGARATIWECGCTSLGVEGQYFRTEPDIIKIICGAGNAGNVLYPTGLKTKYHEWQVGLGLSHRINVLVPYAAVSWSRSKWDTNNAVVALDSGEILKLNDLRNKKPWAYALGLSLIDCEKALLNIEGQFGGTKAISVSGTLRF